MLAPPGGFVPPPMGNTGSAPAQFASHLFAESVKD